MITLYILHSSDHDKFYIGQTKDVEKRLEEHNTSNKSIFTSKYRPWTLVATLNITTRGNAMRAERYLKKKPKEFIRRVLTDKNLQLYISERFSSAG